MDINVSYPLAGLHEAAKYIWENNPSVRNWPSRPTSVFDVMHGMQEMMKETVSRNAAIIIKEKELNTELNNEWISFTGTGGYYFSFELIDSTDDEINVGVTILVDPAVSSPDRGYVTELIDETTEEV